MVRSTKPITFLNAEGQEVTNVPLLANGQAFTLQPSSSSSIATYALDTQTNDEIPEGTTINPQTGAISFIPTADEVGKTYNVPVLVRYADFSQMSVTIPVKVVAATDAQQYPAVGQDITTPAGIVPPAEKGIKNTAELPEGTKYSWENKPIIPNESGKTINSTVVVTYPDGSQDKVDVPITTTENEAEKFDNNNKDNALISGLTVTQGEKVAPSDALKAIKDPDANNVKSATFNENVNTNNIGRQFYPATVTFNDGSTTTVNIPVTVQAPITDADKYKPETQPIDVPAGGQLPDASTGIKNKDDLPSGTTIDWDKKPAVPTKPGEKTEGTVKVTYPDGSSTTVPVEVNGTEPSGKETDADKYKPETQPIDVPAGGQLPDASTGIKNKDDLPSGTTIDWDKKPAVPTKPGEKTEGTVKVTYPDGSSTTVPVEVNGTEPSGKETDADKYKPETQPIDVPAGGQLPDASTGIKNKDDLPSGTTIDWDKKPAVPTKPGEKTEGTVKVTYPDGSSTTVPVEVNGTEPSGKETDADKYKPETQPIDVPAGGQLPDASSAIKNKDKMPIGTKYSWKVTPDLSTVGTHTGVITVEFPDGSSVDVMVKTYVDSGLAAKTDNKSITTSNTSYKLREENSNTHIAEAATIAKNKAAQTNKTLPQTDSKSEEIAGILGLAIAAIGSLLGLGLNRKKRQK